MNAHLVKQQITEIFETAPQIGAKSLGNAWKLVVALLRQSDRNMIVIEGNDGQVYFLSRLSIALAYVFVLVVVRRFRLAALLTVPVLLSRFQLVSEEPAEPVLSEVHDEITVPPKKKKVATRKSPASAR